MKKVYIILVNYNGWQDTIECIESILQSDYNNYQIIVVDNKSPNNSMDFILEWAEGRQFVIYDKKLEINKLSQPFQTKPLPYIYYDTEDFSDAKTIQQKKIATNPIIFIQSTHNNGFAAGNNIGINYALLQNDFKYIWLLNNDTVIENDTLSKMLNSVDDGNCVGIYGTLLKDYYTNEIQTYGGYINKFLGTSHYVQDESNLGKVDFISGASMLITKNCLNSVGLLPENYFLYYEETDYCFKAKKHNFDIKVLPNIVVYHKEGSSTNLSSKNIKMDLLFHENRLKFAKKYLSYIFMVKLGFIVAALKRFKRFEIIQGINLLKLLVK